MKPWRKNIQPFATKLEPHISLSSSGRVQTTERRGFLIKVSLDGADNLFVVKTLAVRAGYRPPKLPDFGTSLAIESLHTTILHTFPPAPPLRSRKNLQAQ